MFSIPAMGAPTHLSHQQQVEVLLEAQRAFDRGSELRRSNPQAAAQAFAEAADRFQLLVDAGVRNGRLYYNLGNACLQAGRLGRAIVNYRRAELLLPGDGRVEANLRVARELRRNQIAVAGERALLRALFFWHYGSAPRMRFVLGLAAYVLFWLMLAARLWARRFRWRFALLPLLAMWLAMGGSLAVEAWAGGGRREGVIVVDDVVARKGNGEGFDPQFEQKLHQGVEFRLREQRGDWLFIELPDGKSGWIRSREAELVILPKPKTLEPIMVDRFGLIRYSGQSLDELLALEGKHDNHILMFAIEGGLQRKATRKGNDKLAPEEMSVLAVMALDREVNNGGYHQFFVNEMQYAPIVVESLNRVGCPKTAVITEAAIAALRLPAVSVAAIEKVIYDDDDERDRKLGECDDRFFEYPENLAERLFAYVKANRSKIRLS